MAELLEGVASWPSLLLVLLVFGFAPGFCLRMIVLAYPRGHPRRGELIAQLYTVPRIERPLWVAEQLEVALFEGLAHRVSAVIRGLIGRARGQRSGRLDLPGVGWVSPCCKAKTEKVSTWVSQEPRSHRCTKCREIYTARELSWEPPLVTAGVEHAA